MALKSFIRDADGISDVSLPSSVRELPGFGASFFTVCILDALSGIESIL